MSVRLCERENSRLRTHHRARDAELCVFCFDAQRPTSRHSRRVVCVRLHGRRRVRVVQTNAQLLRVGLVASGREKRRVSVVTLSSSRCERMSCRADAHLARIEAIRLELLRQRGDFVVELCMQRVHALELLDLGCDRPVAIEQRLLQSRESRACVEQAVVHASRHTHTSTRTSGKSFMVSPVVFTVEHYTKQHDSEKQEVSQSVYHIQF